MADQKVCSSTTGCNNDTDVQVLVQQWQTKKEQADRAWIQWDMLQSEVDQLKKEAQSLCKHVKTERPLPSLPEHALNSALPRANANYVLHSL